MLLLLVLLLLLWEGLARASGVVSLGGVGGKPNK